MTAILSSTNDPTYLFPLPLVCFAWQKLGIKSIVFMPAEGSPVDEILQPMLERLDVDVYPFSAPPEKQATYSQVIRLYAAGLDLPEDEILITSDADMMFLKKGYFINDPRMTVYGSDLTPLGQLPMCYVSAFAKEWRRLLNITGTPQEMCDRELSHINVQNMRGNYWCKDQELLFNAVDGEAFKIRRAREGTQFAANRLDRDDAFILDRMDDDVIDFHTNRPGWTSGNFDIIKAVMTRYFPKENLKWVDEYRNNFIKYLEL